MSRDIQLKKGGRLFVKEWDEEEEDFIEQEIFPEEFMFHFYDSICLEKGINLKDIFLLIDTNVELFSIVFGCPFLDDLVKESKIQFMKDESRSEMYALMLSWNCFVEEEDDEDESILEKINFYGVGDKEYSLDFIPINELIFYPILLDETYSIQDGKTDKIHFTLKKKFTLSDVIRSIIDTLSYMGPPDVKEFVKSEIEKNEENNIMVNAEEIEKKFKEKLKETEKPCCMCGEDSRSADFGKPSDICPKCFRFIKEN